MKLSGNQVLSSMLRPIQAKSASGKMLQDFYTIEKQNASPLSSAQQRMWFNYKLDPLNIAYNKAIAIKINGILAQQVLEKSLNYLAERHQILRTTFTSSKGQLQQKISFRQRYTLSFEDYSQLPYAEGEVKIEEFIQNQIRRPLDLEKGPLVKPFLIRLTPQEHVLLLATHQIVFDQVSEGIFLKELSYVYESLLTKQLPSLPTLPLQFVEYVRREQESINEALLENERSYWKKQLIGELPVLELPTDRLRPAQSRYKGGAYHLFLDEKVMLSVENIAHQTDTSVSCVLLTAYYTLLYRYTSQEDIIIGTPISTRKEADIQNIIGIFRNMLPLRQQLSGEQTFIELLIKVNETVAQAYENQNVPFEKIVEEINPERSAVRHPVYQVLFQMNNLVIPTVKKGGLVFENYKIRTNITDFDLFLDVVAHSGTLSCVFEYDTELFDPETIQRMAGHFGIILDSIASNPSAKISQLSILSQYERNQLLNDWNQSHIPYADQATVHQLFEQQVKQTPYAIAVVSEDKQLTYAELNSRANQLAHYLRKKGVKPSMLVGLCMDRSLELIVSLFAILKAGGGYLPLNPAMPSDYLAFNIQDAQATLLLTHTDLADKFNLLEVELICLDTDWPIIAKEDTQDLDNKTKPSDLAYIIYTSGSTGKPKGVMIEHGSVVNFSAAATKTYEITSKDRILQFASISFDAAVEEIFPFLLQGSTLVLRTELMISSIDLFLKYCNLWNITVLDLPTAFFHLISAETTKPDFKLPSTLRMVLIGGERVLPEQVKLWQNKVGSFPKLINTYGPTESTVVVTTFDLSSFAIDATERIPIGYPISNVKAYILDKHLQPVPVGVPGELHVGGVALAKGYLNRPELTADKFIDNPFIEGGKLYKTGDLVYYRPDGSIIYLGRIDNQVKIRGFRIELGEIEAILSQHENIQDVVVIAREDTPGDKRVVAYVVAKDNIPDEENGLTEYLKSKVPHYMVPSAFVHLPSLPLTVNGKVNKKALPAPKQLTVTRDAYVAPTTEAEQLLTDIWTKLFQQQVGTQDNFFEIGGHSLLAVKLFSEIRNRTGKELPISVLYTNPVIAKLAEFLGDDINSGAWHSLVPIRTSTTKLPVYFIHHGGGTLEYAQRLTLFLDKDQAVYGLQPIGLNGVDKPLKTIEEMAAYYLELILANQPEGPYNLGGYSTGGFIAYEIAKKLTKQGKSLGKLFILDTYPNHLKYIYHDIGFIYIFKSLLNLLTSFTNLKDFYLRKRLLGLIKKPARSVKYRWMKLTNKFTDSGHSPTAVKPSLAFITRRMFLDLNDKAERNYQLESYPGKLVFVRAVENAAEYLLNHDFGWKKFAQGGVTVHDVSGNHGTLFDHTENAKKIAAIVQKHLDESNNPLDSK